MEGESAVYTELEDMIHALDHTHLPELDGLVIGGYDVLGIVTAAYPSDFVDFLLYF